MFRTSKPRLHNKLLCYIAHPNLPDDGTRTSTEPEFALAPQGIYRTRKGKSPGKMQTMDAAQARAMLAGHQH